MLTRLIILIILAGLGVLAYQLMQRWQVRRGTKAAATDPLLANLKPGIPAILYFTTPYCAPCQAQQRPAIQHLVAELGAQSIQVIEVNALEDPAAANRWGVLSVPTTFIIDGTGRPQQVNNGITGPQQLKQQILAIQPR